MKIVQFGLLGALTTILALQAVAQTPPTSSTKPTPSLTVPGPASSARPATASSSSLMDINSASEKDLDTLPGIGKSRADAIIKNRPYNGKDDLVNRNVLPQNVYDGIKDKIIAKKK